MFNEVKTTGAHWNLIKKATNPKVRKTIGPLKRDDDTLALADPEKACRSKPTSLQARITYNQSY